MKARYYPQSVPAQPAYQPEPVEIECFYAIYLGQSRWRVVEPDDGSPIHYYSSEYTSFEDVLRHKPGAIPITMDALAAIAAGMILPDALRYPETLVAAISLCNS